MALPDLAAAFQEVLGGIAVLVGSVDEARDNLDSGPPRQAADGGLGDALQHMVIIEERVDTV